MRYHRGYRVPRIRIPDILETSNCVATTNVANYGCVYFVPSLPCKIKNIHCSFFYKMDDKSIKIRSTREIIGPIFWIKLVGLGSESVGKTSLVRSFCDKKFSKSYHATVGVDYGFKIHELEGVEYRVNFWDFGGDPDYELIRTELYRDTQGCMLIFDVTSRTSFEKLDGWLEEFYDNGGKGAVVIVIGNKCDKLNRQISIEEGKKWAEQNGCSYYETSAASKSGVKELLNGLLTAIVERRLIKPKWIGDENKPK
ncbi:ras-related protein Rab-13-like [Dendronephthya gigantea]|uniref:ras-related protein Rab-13-like n=1 Tax=Dendronephthya gigantea TaxID=151771 RepID=UPI00106A6C87|nr:ras-related protein Rab-13-like [Dendronephthya gigantea]